MHPSLPQRTLVLLLSAIAVAGLTACSSGEPARPTLRLGYFPNLTHAAAIIGVGDGTFADALGEDVALETAIFNSGTEATEAIFNEAIDMSFVGPSPAINAFSESDGAAIRIVSGATSGGAALVVRAGIDTPADLAGTTLASPSLGNTQDVALRAWLAEQGYETTTEGGGDVAITPLANADILAAFAAGDLDGAWVPEPYATRLVVENDGHVLVDEAALWPEGQFVTTQLMVATSYLDAHPENVKGILTSLIEITDRLVNDSAASKAAVNAQLEILSGAPLNEEVLDGAWDTLTFTLDPIAKSLRQGAANATEVGLLDPVDLDGIYDLTLLNEALAEVGKPSVSA